MDAITGMIIGITGILGFLVCLFWLVIALFKRKPKKLILLGLAVSFVLFCVGVFAPTESENTNSDIQEVTETSEKIPDGAEETTPEVTYENDDVNAFEKTVQECIANSSGSLATISDEESAIYLDIICKNKEKTVNSIVDGIASAVVQNEVGKPCTLTFKESKDGANLVIVDIATDGSVVFSYTSPNFKSEYNEWVDEQFTIVDGSHIILTDLILQNLNDPESYEHIETNYEKIATEERKTEINNVFASDGYSQRVEIDDLFIVTEFRAKNAFGGYVRNYAYGIASYTNETITLIDIVLA